jgi:hypothetical protein
MLRFSPVKCVVWVWTWTVVVATKPDINTDRQLDQRVSLVRKLAGPSRYCLKTSDALTSADYDLSGQYLTVAYETCPDFRCDFNYAFFPAYKDYKKACSAANGAFARYKATLLCSDGTAFVLKNIPLCLVSENANKNCAPMQLGDDLESFYDDFYRCAATVTNTGYADSSGNKPVKKPVKRPHRRPRNKRVRR